MSNYKFLADIHETKFFYEKVLSPLKRNEVRFISNSARNKQLSEEERKQYQVGRSEMWHKEVIIEDSFEAFIKGIKRCEVNDEAYTTKAGVPYPAKCLVMYVYFCNIDAAKAMDDQIRYLLDIQKELLNSCLNNSESGVDQAFYNIRNAHKIGQSIFAGSKGTCEWVDLDIDIENHEDKESAYKIIHNELYPYCGENNLAIIETANGFHCLLRKKIVRSNPNDLIKQIEMKAEGKVHIKEAIINPNLQIPCPGTLAYGSHIVTIRNKGNFSA